ncbi:transcriptional regulator [Desulfosporosinus orientis DSM 765]|uniref:Transcriptional regulator n=2 Tax=Desulfosporosinus orientis TaxID=1563 RepID=G7W752_DESOD|nr:transcriptional regulator [Desulfosporosinus orientis DSM 765]
MYPKGIETRDRIVEAAKKIFYNHGYKNSTLKMITEEAEVSLSAVPYYFRKKYQIVREIYNDFLETIYAFLKENLAELPDSYQLHFYATRIYYRIILGDDNNRRFYIEVNNSEHNYMLAYPFIDQVYENYAKDFNIPLTEMQRQLMRMADGGGRKEILDRYFNNMIDIDVDDLCDYLTSLAGTLIGIHMLVAEKYAKKSTEFVNTLDYSHIKILI